MKQITWRFWVLLTTIFFGMSGSGLATSHYFGVLKTTDRIKFEIDNYDSLGIQRNAVKSDSFDVVVYLSNDVASNGPVYTARSGAATPSWISRQLPFGTTYVGDSALMFGALASTLTASASSGNFTGVVRAWVQGKSVRSSFEFSVATNNNVDMATNLDAAVSAVRDTAHLALHTSAVTDSNFARLVTHLTYRDSTQTKAIRDSVALGMTRGTITDSNLARLVTHLTYRDSSQTKAIRDSVALAMTRGTITDSNLARLVTHLTYRDSSQTKAIRDSVALAMTRGTITDSNMARLVTHLTYRDSIQTKAIRDSVQFLMTLKAVTDSNLARLITHLTYRDSTQAKAVRDSVQFFMTLKTITDSNLARYVTKSDYTGSGGGGSGNDSLQIRRWIWDSTSGRYMTGSKAYSRVVDSNKTELSGGGGTGAKTIRMVALDTSGTDTPVTDVHITMQVGTQDDPTPPNLWTNGSGFADFSLSAGTDYVVQARLNGYQFINRDISTGATNVLENDTIFGYNLVPSITAPGTQMTTLYETAQDQGGTVLPGAKVTITLNGASAGYTSSITVLPTSVIIFANSSGLWSKVVVGNDSIFVAGTAGTTSYNIKIEHSALTQPVEYKNIFVPANNSTTRLRSLITH